MLRKVGNTALTYTFAVGKTDGSSLTVLESF